jgi:hypothetical protein
VPFVLCSNHSLFNEMRFDGFNDDFIFIITQSRTAITQRTPHDGSTNKKEIVPTISTDNVDQLDMIPPLFLTATRCRMPYPRRQALSLLRTSQSVDGV